MLEKIVSENEDCMRADRFVKALCADVGFGALQKLFRTKKIKINGIRAHASDKVHHGDCVKIFAALSESYIRNHCPSDPKLFGQLKDMIIYENENFFAINKPAKLAVQLGSKVNFCVETLIKAYPNQQCFLVHRLDKDTSGVLLIAKNQQWARKLTAMFREGQIQKTYLALVDGKIRSAGIIDNYLEKSFVGNEEKMRITKSTDGLHAVTHYTPIKMIGYSTLLELKPRTGRKHQLRVHCAEELHAPIIGDRKYNPNTTEKNMFLHAYKIYLFPLDIEITAELPEYFHLGASSENPVPTGVNMAKEVK